MTLRRTCLSAFAALSLVALAGCDMNKSADTRQQSDERSEVLRQQTTTESVGGIGEQAVKSGEAEVQEKEVVIEKKVERDAESIPTITSGVKKADINKMDKEDFVALGLSEKAAENIVSHREKNGQFTSVDELSQVPGVDQQWLAKYRDKLGLVPRTGGEEAESR